MAILEMLILSIVFLAEGRFYYEIEEDFEPKKRQKILPRETTVSALDFVGRIFQRCPGFH